MADLAILALFAIGTGFSVYSGVSSAAFSREAARATERTAEQQADQLRQEANIEANLRRRRARLLRGQQAAAFTAGGVIAADAGPLDFLAATVKEEEFAIQRTLRQGEVQARNVIGRGQIASESLRAQAQATILGTVGGVLQSGAVFGTQGGFRTLNRFLPSGTGNVPSSQGTLIGSNINTSGRVVNPNRFTTAFN